MTDTLVKRPVPLSRVWSGTKIIAENVEGDDLSDVLQLHSDASAWWVMPRADPSTEPELRHAAHALDLDELAIRDLLAVDHRAKFEELGQARLVLTNAVSVNHKTAELSVHPVSLVVTDRALICLVDATPDGFHPARLLSSEADHLAEGGVEHAMQCVLGAVINTYRHVVEWLEDSSDKLSRSLFAERPLSQSEQIRAFRLRNALARLRRVTDPMRTVLDELVDGQDTTSYVGREWVSVQQQHHRVANAADALVDALKSVFDTSLALADLRMNSIMKKLTGWAGIIAVPTLVTGFVGMNVSFPLDGTEVGFWVYTAVMAVAVVLLWLTFRRKDWI